MMHLSQFLMSLSRFISLFSIFFGVTAFLWCLIFAYWWWALFFFILYNYFLLYPCLNPYSRWYGPVTTRFETEERAVWLTIDDGPCDGDLELLDILNRYAAKATFFVTGKKVEQHPDIIDEILSRGHRIGNHTMTHPEFSFWRYTPRQIEKEIDACNLALEKHLDQIPSLFRCPVGMKNIFVHPILKRKRMKLLAWSHRGYDGVLNDVDQIMNRLTKDITPGSIILLHSGREVSSTVLEHTLLYLKKENYVCRLPS